MIWEHPQLQISIPQILQMLQILRLDIAADHFRIGAEQLLRHRTVVDNGLGREREGQAAAPSSQGPISDLIAQSAALANLNRAVEQRDFGANLAREIARADLLDAGALGRVHAARLEFAYDLRAWRPGVDYRDVYSAHRAPSPRRVLMFMAEKAITGIEIVNVDLNSGEHRSADARAVFAGERDVHREILAELLPGPEGFQPQARHRAVGRGQEQLAQPPGARGKGRNSRNFTGHEFG